MVTALLLTGCTDGSEADPPDATDTPSRTQPVPDALNAFYDQEIEWRNCDDFECANIEVPLDYADPSSGSINLALLRRRANDRAHSRGIAVG